jgi:hypothetical protein
MRLPAAGPAGSENWPRAVGYDLRVAMKIFHALLAHENSLVLHRVARRLAGMEQLSRRIRHGRERQ